MNTLSAAEIVARIVGPLYVVVGIGMLVNPEAYKRMGEGFVDSPALTYFGGATALAAGLAVLTFHHGFSGLFPALISVLAWIAVVKGAALLLVHGAAMKLSQPIMTSTAGLRICGAVALVLGAYLAAKGYRIV